MDAHHRGGADADRARPPAGATAASSANRPNAALRFSAAASAAALALALVEWNAIVLSWLPVPNHVDALFNEWAIWFTAAYVALVGVAALVERVRTVYRRRAVGRSA